LHVTVALMEAFVDIYKCGITDGLKSTKET
jgi:hypothetical protein